MRLALLLTTLSLLSGTALANQPEETLNQYFQILTSRNYDSIGSIMDSQSMASLKQLLDAAITQEAKRGRFDLQRRVFGEQVSAEKVANTPADFYLNRLASEVLNAADNSRFYVDNRKILGRVDESDTVVHFVSRLYMHQGNRENSDIYTYTLIKEGDTWKLNFPPTIKQMLALIETSANLTR